MTVRSQFFGRRISERRILPIVAPLVIILAALPFTVPSGPTHQIAIAVGRVSVTAACLIPIVLFGYEIVAMKRAGWSRKYAADTAKTVIVWLAACLVVSYVF
jgi:hypothetical protein